MAKWDFKIVGASFVKELVPVGDDVNPRSQSFMQPSFDLEGDKIVMKESGQYKTAISFTQIGEIDGVAPTDLEDAYAKLLVLVENFNGGGGAPGTTPTLQQVTDEGATTTNSIVSSNGLQGAEVTATNGTNIVALSPDIVGVLFNNGTNIGTLNANGLNGEYVWELPNANGTLALTSVTERGVFSGEFALSNAASGGEYTPLTQSGALTLSVGGSAVNGGVDSVKITANGSAITVPGGWINIGSDSISVVNGAVNRIMVRQYQNEIWYTVKVS